MSCALISGHLLPGASYLQLQAVYFSSVFISSPLFISEMLSEPPASARVITNCPPPLLQSAVWLSVGCIFKFSLNLSCHRWDECLPQEIVCGQLQHKHLVKRSFLKLTGYNGCNSCGHSFLKTGQNVTIKYWDVTVIWHFTRATAAFQRCKK